MATAPIDVEPRTFCEGSYTRIVSKKGSKYIRGVLKYPCPTCGKHYTRDGLGYLTKHGYKLSKGPMVKSTPCLCAQCRKTFDSPDGFDYLCPKCRG